ncbi:hypothetical protein M3B43_07385 [Nesterenkonia massiliensis]|uniref:Uncharacterized protein n=1 Tax=Nesterenkonia massiliensis TaxID=1232429 RepID=A0ABT2HR28_9MICC|nr:hypothetical protein [Nesterenkonia massiliensis]MCT1607150.1 hypothetical protein [Nesterenkonia massiliensis]
MRGKLRPSKRPAKIRLRVQVNNLPAGAAVELTDVQLQPGATHSGWLPHVTELPWSAGVSEADMLPTMSLTRLTERVDALEAQPPSGSGPDAVARQMAALADERAAEAHATATDGLARLEATQSTLKDALARLDAVESDIDIVEVPLEASWLAEGLEFMTPARDRNYIEVDNKYVTIYFAVFTTRHPLSHPRYLIGTNVIPAELRPSAPVRNIGIQAGGRVVPALWGRPGRLEIEGADLRDGAWINGFVKGRRP